MNGIKHSIKCRCILPQFKNRKEIIFHEFIVFSIVDDEGNLKNTSYAQCNNCGIIHKIVDLCRSKILQDKENLKSVETIEDIKLFLPDSLSNIMENYNCMLATWQHTKFIIQHEQWGHSIILTKEKDDNDDTVYGKFLIFKNKNKFIIEPFQENGNLL